VVGRGAGRWVCSCSSVGPADALGAGVGVGDRGAGVLAAALGAGVGAGVGGGVGDGDGAGRSSGMTRGAIGTPDRTSTGPCGACVGVGEGSGS